MKKLTLYLLGFFGFCLALANEDTTVPNYNYAVRPIGTDVAENPYSVEKQYAKADQIKQGNRFYNLKKADEVAMVGDTEDKYYSLVDIYKLAAEHNADYQAADYVLLQTKREVYASTVEAYQTVVLYAVRIEAFRKSVYSGIASVKAILEGFEARDTDNS